jgi:dihydroorotate dehydrogenase
VVLNVSSPNTPNLRQLQDESRLRELLGAVTAANRAREAQPGKRRVPILLKIAPDLTWPQIDVVLGVIAEFGLDGIIATNTTLARPGFFATVSEAGGLSGAPLRFRSTEIINYISRVTRGRLPIIGVGGISDEVSGAEKLDAGATLLQIYTGMIYRGPFFAADLARALVDRQRS